MNKICFILSAAVLACCLNNCGNARKTASDTSLELAGIHWKLIELNGAPVETDQSAVEPYIEFDKYTNRFSGSAGCNRVVGSYELNESGIIDFSKAAVTKMMCLNMELENQFLKILDFIERYKIEGETLTLFGAEDAPLARFKAVPSNL